MLRSPGGGPGHTRPQHLVRGVPGEQVEPIVDHAGRHRRQRVEYVLHLRLHLLAPGRGATGDGGRVRQVGKLEQVLPLGLVEQQDAGHRAEHLRARVDLAALFQPGVPGDPDTGELCDLLTAQPGSTAPRARRQPCLLGGDPFPAGAQERGQLGTAMMPVRGGHGVHDSILPGRRRGCQVLRSTRISRLLVLASASRQAGSHDRHPRRCPACPPSSAARPEPLGRPRGGSHGAVHGRARRLRCQRGGPLDPCQPAHLRRWPATCYRRVRDHLRGASGHRRKGRARYPWPPAYVPGLAGPRSPLPRSAAAWPPRPLSWSRCASSRAPARPP